MKPVNLAVIGAGYWGRKVIRQVLELSQTTDCVRLHSVVDNSPTMLEQCRMEFGEQDYRIDYRGLMTDQELSAVHICTPNTSHFEIASAFLKAGKHVLVEKPLALRSIEALELVRLASANNRVLSVGHVHRFNNAVREFRNVLLDGVLGDLYYLRIRWTGHLPPQKQRDVITDLAPHPFDVSNHILGQWPTKITCRGDCCRTQENEEVAFITAEYEAGVTVNIEVSWLDMEKRREVTVVGSRGSAHLDCLEQKIILHTEACTQQLPVIPSNTLESEMIHFLECINRNGHSDSHTNLSDGVLGANVVRLLEASQESLRHGITASVNVAVPERITIRWLRNRLRPRLPLNGSHEGLLT